MGLPDIPNKGPYGHRSQFMRVYKLSKKEFSNGTLAANAGIHFVYGRSDGEQTALMFLGEEFAMPDSSQQSVLKAWRNVFATYWEVYAEMERLKDKNDGIRTVLTAKIPDYYVVTSKDGKSKMVPISNSVWSAVGMKPTAKTLDKFIAANNHDKKRMVFQAALAAFDALKFKVNFERYEGEKKDEKKEEEAA